VLAWHQRQQHFQKQHQHAEKPWCVEHMENGLNIVFPDPKVSDAYLGLHTDSFMALDFDMIDWSAWEKDGYAQLFN
jgi:hypothetical protein